MGLPRYEIGMILRPELEEERAAVVLEKLGQTIVAAGGEPGEVEKWGRRRLAYEIAGEHDGLFFFLPFEAGPAVPAAVDRQAKLQEEIIRHQIVRLDE